VSSGPAEEAPDGDRGPVDGFVRLQAILDDVVTSLAGPRTTAKALGSVFTDWAAIVGDTVAEQTTPLRLERGVLLIGVAQPAWAAQLKFMRNDLVARCASHLGPGVVTTIELRVTGR
jgi:predicted nucleic acid-binding Zn ribbon protein